MPQRVVESRFGVSCTPSAAYGSVQDDDEDDERGLEWAKGLGR